MDIHECTWPGSTLLSEEGPRAASDLETQVGSTRSSDVEETIMTEGAHSLIAESRLRKSQRETSVPSSSSSSCTEEEGIQPPRRIGFPPLDELPRWFPKNIVTIYAVDRHGGALSYKELDTITRYRALLEIAHRRKWKHYVKAGKLRWKLQRIVRRLKARSRTKSFSQYFKKLFDESQVEALNAWKKLEKIHRGTVILDETININFRQERIIYAKGVRSL